MYSSTTNTRADGLPSVAFNFDCVAWLIRFAILVADENAKAIDAAYGLPGNKYKKIPMENPHFEWTALCDDDTRMNMVGEICPPLPSAKWKRWPLLRALSVGLNLKVFLLPLHPIGAPNPQWKA